MSEQIDRNEIALLAYYAWERDGRPDGQDIQYWIEAEKQIEATRHLLLQEIVEHGMRLRTAELSKTLSKKFVPTPHKPEPAPARRSRLTGRPK